jgi:hypothetical protein
MLTSKIFSKSAIAVTIVTLALASVSATSVFAASSRMTTRNAQDRAQSLESNWKSDTDSLHIDKFLDARIDQWVARWLKDNTTAADKIKANDLEKRFDTVFRQAEALASKHPGFERVATVIDPALAAKSVRELGADLHQLDIVMKSLRDLMG